MKIGIGNVIISSRAKKNVLKVLDSGRLSYGDFSRKFETKTAALHNRKYAILCNSGTSALQVAIAVLKDKYSWKDQDEVLVPTVTFIATSNIVLQNNLKPVFVDVERDFFGIDVDKIEAKITKKTRAIIPVHLFGQSCEMDKIMQIAKIHNLKVVEDSCEAMFVKYRGKPVGSKGDIACFSTYATHLITTGVGGLAMTNDDDLAIRIKSYFNHGRDSIYLSMDDDDVKNPKKLFKIVDRRFSFIHLGYSYRLTELEAALGVVQVDKWKEIISKRQKNAAIISKGLSRWSSFINTPKIRPGAQHAFMLYPIVIVDKKIKRDDLISFLEVKGIETRYLMPLLNQPVYKKIFGNIENKFLVAKFLNENAFIIGCHQDLKKNELEYVVKTFDDFFRRYQSG